METTTYSAVVLSTGIPRHLFIFKEKYHVPDRLIIREIAFRSRIKLKRWSDYKRGVPVVTKPETKKDLTTKGIFHITAIIPMC
jgi:hypothetical protein